ncbi:MAG: hypothetical protein U0167_15455 [bacterium]
MAERLPTKFDEAARERYLAALAACGVFMRAASVVGISERNARLVRKADKSFAEACDDARAFYAANVVDKHIEDVVLHGRETDVLYQGKKVGTRIEWSDRLTELWAKRHEPAYRDHVGEVTVNNTFAPMVVPAQAVPQPGESPSQAWRRESNARVARRVDAPARVVETNNPDSPVRRAEEER